MTDLNIFPRQRMLNYLLDFDGWSPNGRDDRCYYYNQFPEFTIKMPTEATNEVDSHESWVRFGLAPKSHVYEVEFKYYQTILYVEDVLSYDDWRNFFPVPYNTECLKIFGEIVLYYYIEENSFKFNYLQFLYKRLTYASKLDRVRNGFLPLIIFKSKDEKQDFVHYLCSQYNEKDIDDADIYIRNPNDDFTSYSKELDIAQMKLCKFAFEKLIEWRDTNTLKCHASKLTLVDTLISSNDL